MRLNEGGFRYGASPSLLVRLESGWTMERADAMSPGAEEIPAAAAAADLGTSKSALSHLLRVFCSFRKFWTA